MAFGQRGCEGCACTLLLISDSRLTSSPPGVLPLIQKSFENNSHSGCSLSHLTLPLNRMRDSLICIVCRAAFRRWLANLISLGLRHNRLPSLAAFSDGASSSANAQTSSMQSPMTLWKLEQRPLLCPDPLVDPLSSPLSTSWSIFSKPSPNASSSEAVMVLPTFKWLARPIANDLARVTFPLTVSLTVDATLKH